MIGPVLGRRTLLLRSSISIPKRHGSVIATPSATTNTTITESKKNVNLHAIEASWKSLQPQEQDSIFRHLEELQKKDWKDLTVDEKKAAYYVSFGAHGPREPVIQPGQAMRTLTGVVALVTASAVVFAIMRHFGGEPPKTRTREWEEAMNERAIELKMDPFTGPSSEGYKGRGHVSGLVK